MANVLAAVLAASAVAVGRPSFAGASVSVAGLHRVSKPSTNLLECAPLPSDTEVPDLFLLGQGRCVNSQGLTPLSFACNATAAPDACAAVSTNATACAAQCHLDDGCTGFELSTDPSSGALRCLVFFRTLPAPLQWVVGDAGTQLVNSSQRTVVTTDGSSSTCCYRRSYPRPCPLDMPILKPPQQSGRAKELFAAMAARAKAASEAVVPALADFIEFCAANAVDRNGRPENLFGVDLCPGLADLTANGTLAAWPSPAQIIQRFSDEMLAMEYGHGYAPLWDKWGCSVLGGSPCIDDPTLVLNPLLPVLPNLYQPMTLGWNASPTATAAPFTPVMRNVFGLDEFANNGTFTYNFTDAANRMTYTASNYVRGPVGNTLGNVGGFNVVLRPNYVRDMMLITPGDSWHYEPQFPHCTGWPNCTAGTIDHALHILYAWMTGGGLYPNPPAPTSASCEGSTSFLRYAVCAIGPNFDRKRLPLSPANVPTYYFEVNAVGMIRYPEGVKLLTVAFPEYFGTPFGALLREWCRHWRWALAWVLQYPSDVVDGRRLLDPTVLASTTVNVSLDAGVAEKFEGAWAAVVAANASNVTTDFRAVWTELVNETSTPTVGNALTWNIGVRDCQDYDNCFGLADSSGQCVCYAPTA
jgi:hypothetical protein